MPYSTILMSYKENCKIEGVVLTKLKMIRMYHSGKRKKEIAKAWRCNKNTVTAVIASAKGASEEAMRYLQGSAHIPSDKLMLFDFLCNGSRKPKSHSRCLGETEENHIIEKHTELHYGFRRMYRHLKRKHFDMGVYTLAKIKGVYKRHALVGKKIRTTNGERRALYNYDEIEAFEYLQYDTKTIADMHALPADLYWKFKRSGMLPRYQWTIIDAKTKIRFLAWSYSLSSFFGLKFLEFVIVWLRSHNVITTIHIQFDGGGEFCSASERKLATVNAYLQRYDAVATQTGGAKWKQNIVERSHRIDDEEFYCPRGEYMNSKADFLLEGQQWIIYYNNRQSDGIGLSGMTPNEKLSELGYYNADDICGFPCLIMEDYYEQLHNFFTIKSQNVLTPYRLPRDALRFTGLVA